MKSTPEGFANYYVEREKRLSGLKEGSATIEIAQVAQEDGYVLKIRVRDSGKGFEPDGRPKHVETLLETPVPSGRGIDLIRSLCESLQYFNSGSMAEAVYYLGKNQ
jgi:anti-sigma regulatory factor (Ser/Thr protein kinase)